jgi:hypothetical protein
MMTHPISISQPIVLSSSHSDQYITKSYTMQANSHIVKPVDLGIFKVMAEKLEQYWFSLVVLHDRKIAPRISL